MRAYRRARWSMRTHTPTALTVTSDATTIFTTIKATTITFSCHHPVPTTALDPHNHDHSSFAATYHDLDALRHRHFQPFFPWTGSDARTTAPRKDRSLRRNRRSHVRALEPSWLDPNDDASEYVDSARSRSSKAYRHQYRTFWRRQTWLLEL